MIRVEGLHFSYANQSVLQGVDLRVEAGEILSILGPNGCGKSTLLKLLRGVLSPTRGRVIWDNQEACRLNRKAMAQRVGVVPQSTWTTFPYPVREVVSMGRFARQSGFLSQTTEDRIVVEKSLALTDTLHLADRSATELSGGELQRVLLARALAQEAPVLLLDEATSNLDLDHRLEFTDLLLRLNQEQGTTIIQVSHDLDQAAETSHRILLLTETGAPAALGPPAEVYTPDNLKQVFRAEVKVEPSPYTGCLRTYPVRRSRENRQKLPRVHLLCGGGSGGEMMRRLHLAGGEITVGPINRGDSDQILASALGLEAIMEKPFCPISESAMEAALELASQAEWLIVSPTLWGNGNQPCLDLIQQALDRKIPVILMNPSAERDFTEGKVWEKIEVFLKEGARSAEDVQSVLESLSRSA